MKMFQQVPGTVRPEGLLACAVAAFVSAFVIVVGMQSVSLAEEKPPAVLALAVMSGETGLIKSDAGGLYRSVDGGRSWSDLQLAFPETSVITSIAVASGDFGGVYAAGPGVGVLRSDDSGETWTLVEGNLPTSEISALAAHSTEPDTLYAYLPADGIYRSRDGGKDWKLMDRGPEAIRQLVHTDMAGSMETGWLYATTDSGVQFSMDCFCLWRESEGIPAAATAIAVNPERAEELYVVSGKTVFQTFTGGRDWQTLPPPAQTITALAVISGALLAGTSDGHLIRLPVGASIWEQVDE